MNNGFLSGLLVVSLFAGGAWAGPVAAGEFGDINPETVLQGVKESRQFVEVQNTLAEAAKRKPRQISQLPLSSILLGMPGRNLGWFNKPGDPVNMVFLGTKEAIYNALTAAGWASVPNNWIKSALDGARQAARGMPITEFPPMEPFWINGKHEDMNWVEIVKPVLERHHFRLWRARLTDERGRTVWWGSASYDNGINWPALTHATDPDRDKERGYISSVLAGSYWVDELALSGVLPQVPLQGINSYGELFHDDGRALVVSFR